MKEFVGLNANLSLMAMVDGTLFARSEAIVVTSEPCYRLDAGGLSKYHDNPETLRIGFTTESLQSFIAGCQTMLTEMKQLEDRAPRLLPEKKDD